MTPAELLDDHQRKPRNVGKLLNASAVGDVGSIVVGDALEPFLGHRMLGFQLQHLLVVVERVVLGRTR